MSTPQKLRRRPAGSKPRMESPHHHDQWLPPTIESGKPAQQGDETATPESFLRRLGRRSEDRRKAPRRWWYPLPADELAIDPADLRAQHNECSKAIQRTTTALVAFCLFCALALGTPDAALLGASSKVALPFSGGGDASFLKFLFIGPPVSRSHGTKSRSRARGCHRAA